MPRGQSSLAAAAATGTDGIVTTANLHAAGISRRLAERAVATQRWQRAARGIYVPHPPPLTNLDLVRAARAYVDGPMVVTGVVVLRELGLRWLPSIDSVHLRVPDSVRRTSSAAVRVTRTSGFDELTTWVRYGERMADPAQAVADAARHADGLRTARGIVLGAVADRWAGSEELRRRVDRGRRNGSALLHRAVSDAERGCASPPEAELVDALVGRGVPFLVNPEVSVAGRSLGFVDVWLLGTAVGGEVESVERHEGGGREESTYDRHERFRVDGLDLVHLSVRRIRADADEAVTHLLRQAAAGPQVPSGLVVRPRGPVLR